ncbi:peptide/nickel transport system substrate-binding protein [Pontibacter aydingkolensis]|uniref:ABC transporter substrate-binding protein n=1 Tax=Pontibacter aydingkolensis TaxID=1911536 RepID=A0ABS7CVV0_9BACT|nr:ABC transporter substrate-binding protein [Pontibacter aydingkolensis]MBW7467981.1 ABC transporter substrate-binding protein [Pontibacter aydingkolensis]
MRKVILFLPLLLLTLSFCSQPQQGLNEVKVRLPLEPETLSPANYAGAEAVQIINLLFQSLLVVDLEKDKLQPALATNMPSIVRQDSLTLFTYELRENATWSDGSPVTAGDVAFTLKVLKAPLVNNDRIKPQVEFIRDIRLDNTNPRKFTFVCVGYAPEMELLTGDFFILPSYLFDPQGLLKSIQVADLSDDLSGLENNADLKAFADKFNAINFKNDKALLQGSGGYLLDNHTPGQYLVLQRKQNWWGNESHLSHLTAKPERISFHIIPDNTTALLALKNQQLDVLDNIPAAEFDQFKADKAFTKNFALHTPDAYECTYVGLNSRLAKFADKRTRQAIAQLLDVNSMIQVSQQSYATPTVSIIPPSIKEYYNNSLKAREYNLAKAKSLLSAAGWSREQDGWYKIINGKKTRLTIEVVYRAGNTNFENAALVFQQGAAKAGIPVTLQAMENSLLSQKLKAHEFDMFFRSLSGNPFAFNFKGLLGTSAAQLGGPNYTGFGDQASDNLLDDINAAETTAEKAKLLKQFQATLYDEATFIPLYYQKERIAVHNRFTNTKISGLSPNYDVSAFTLKN